MVEPSIKVGEIYKTNRSGDLEIIEYVNCYNIRVKFITTGFENTFAASSIREGCARDPYYPMVFGVGFFGEGSYISRGFKCKKKTPQYQAWENMLARCYYPKTNRYSAYGGSGVTVCKEWHNYQTFAKWFDENYQEGYHLDKDIILKGNKEYGPDTCCFVPQEINGLLVVSQTNDLPVGVKYSRNKKKYTTHLNKKSLGTYDTINEAKRVYNEEKACYIMQKAEDYFRKGKIKGMVRVALYDIAEQLLEENDIEYKD